MAASDSAARAGDKGPAEVIFTLLFLLSGAAIIAAIPWYMSTRPGDPSPVFSVMVTHTSSVDPLYGPVIHPAFDVYLRVDNGMDTGMCRENATVTVSHGGMVLAFGKVGDFCVDKRASVEVKAALTHADVVLTDELLWNMAAELQAGEMEVSVEVKMLFPRGGECQHCARDIMQYYRVRPGQGYSPCSHCQTLEFSY